MPAIEKESTSASSHAIHSVLRAARSALESLEQSWDLDRVETWAQHVVNIRGRVVLSGMGKSGLVAQKISATLASTGCPSFFMHPADALHGDLGMVTPNDTALLLSNSGESEELLRLLPNLKRIAVKTGAITSHTESRLGQSVDWCFSYQLPQGEGCPLAIAPMASTTLQLVWGDALAAYLMVKRGFTLEDYAERHPAGNIGARLLKIRELMHTEIPRIEPQATLVQVLSEMSKGHLGMTCVMEKDGLVGVISDGDIRRALERAESQKINPLSLSAADLMTRRPVQVNPEAFAVDVAGIMEGKKITFLVVSDGVTPCGVIHIHDLLAAKVI